MWELIKVVIPKVKAKWDSLAYCMRYTPEEVNGFRQGSRDCDDCCKNLFSNWISTGHGPCPKTYQTLLEHMKEIEELKTASDKAKEELIKGTYLNKQHSC